MGERGGLAGGADGHQAMDAARDLALDQAHERLLVDGSVAKRRHKRRKDAFEQRLGHEACKLP
jgi:hypothetical protein